MKYILDEITHINFVAFTYKISTRNIYKFMLTNYKTHHKI